MDDPRERMEATAAAIAQDLQVLQDAVARHARDPEQLRRWLRDYGLDGMYSHHLHTMDEAARRLRAGNPAAALTERPQPESTAGTMPPRNRQGGTDGGGGQVIHLPTRYRMP